MHESCQLKRPIFPLHRFLSRVRSLSECSAWLIQISKHGPLRMHTALPLHVQRLSPCKMLCSMEVDCMPHINRPSFAGTGGECDLSLGRVAPPIFQSEHRKLGTVRLPPVSQTEKDRFRLGFQWTFRLAQRHVPPMLHVVILAPSWYLTKPYYNSRQHLVSFLHYSLSNSTSHAIYNERCSMLKGRYGNYSLLYERSQEICLSQMYNMYCTHTGL